MMHVLRMENEQGFGPFVYQPDGDGMAQALPYLEAVPGVGVGATDSTHPHHMRDISGADLGGDTAGFIEMIFGSPWRVGVKDKNQFYHWFPKSSFDFFNKEGFELAVYDVPDSDVKAGQFQLMFPLDKARLVKREPLTAFEKESD